MERRRNPETETTNKELEEIENTAKDNQKASRAKKSEEKFRQTVANTKVPVHGNLRVEVQDDKATRVLGVDINIMSYWLKDNYKAERLKLIFEKHGVDIAGLQEVCIN